MHTKDRSALSPDAAPESNPPSDQSPTGTSGTTSRRSFLNRSAAAGGAVALSPYFSRARKGEVTIQFAALIDQTGEQTHEIEQFNRLHARKIKVEYVQLPPVATDQYSKFVTAFRSHSPTPDVVQIDVTWPAPFANSGWLAPLDQHVDSHYLEPFWPSARTVGKIKGKLYGIQRFMDIGMLYYRTDLVKKYGGPPQYLTHMEHMAKEILAHEARRGMQYGYLMAGKKIEAVVDEWLEFVWGAGGDIGSPGHLNVDGRIQSNALQYMRDLIYKTKLAPPGTSTYAPNDILALFSSGKAPFMRNWTFAWALLNDPTKSSVAGKVGVAPVPASPQHIGHGCTGGWVLAINAYSTYKDEAWTFIDYMLSKQTQTSLALHAGLIPSRHDVVTDHRVQAQVPYFKHIETILEQGKNRPTLTNYNQFTTIVQGAISAVLSNLNSAASALRDIQSQVTSLT